MRKLLLLLFSALFVLSAQAEDVLRLMTYNVRNANGMDGICNYQRVANVINNARPDIVAIQELDSMTARSNRTDVLNCIPALRLPSIMTEESMASVYFRKRLRSVCKPSPFRDVKRHARCLSPSSRSMSLRVRTFL